MTPTGEIMTLPIEDDGTSNVTPLPVPPTHTNFLLWREVDRLERLISQQQVRLDHLDQYGTRGVESLRIEVNQLRRDIEDHERQHVESVKESKSGRRWLIGVVVALVVPLYPLLISMIFNN